MRGILPVVLVVLSWGWVEAQLPPRASVNSETGLMSFSGCELVQTVWGDGDSFSVRFPNGKDYTIRLYGVDCIETRDRDATDKRRLRAQRRYFGIAKAGGSESASVLEAKKLGRMATERVRELLEKPFEVHTAWADGRGDPEFKRYYGFITDADGRDLGGQLVREGLARAFGVTRARRVGVSQEEYRQRLKDEELAAASRRAGAWGLTNWRSLPEERRVERAQEQEEKAREAPAAPNSIDLNSAARDELMRLPGIGEVMAIRIMEAREDGKFHKAEDLERVSGIGPKTVKRLAPFLKFPAPGSGR